MKRKFPVIGLCVLAGVVFFTVFAWKLILPSRSEPPDKKAEDFIRVNRLCDGVIVVGLGYDAITAIATQNGLVVIDAGISNSLTAKYRQAIAREFKSDRFLYLINTHAHPDHIGGNQVFSDAVIIGHDNCQSEISGYWRNPEKNRNNLRRIVADYEQKLPTLAAGSAEWNNAFTQTLRYRHAFNDLTTDRVITPPTLRFTDQLNLALGDVSFYLIYFGEAHSTSDIVIQVPEKRLLLVGDLFSGYGRPSFSETGDQGKVARWKMVMQWIGARREKIDHVIGGHGEIMTRADLEAFLQYVASLPSKE